MHLSRRPQPTPNAVIFKAILGRCVIVCDIAWHVPEDLLSLFTVSALSLCLSFCLSLIKKPNHADSSEQITSHSLWMFEDDGATGETGEQKYTWILLVLKANTIFYFFFSFAFSCSV